MASFETPICTMQFDLNNGDKIPATGYGAMEKGIFFDAAERPRIVDTIVKAIQAGIRLIDTAKIYATEEIVGEAVRTCGVPRSKLTVVTKLSQEDHGRVADAFREAHTKLGTYVDIYLMHWPCAYDGDKPLPIEASPTYVETWKAMEKLVGSDCKAIGVSNFTQKTLEVLLREATIKPVANQIEITPINPNLRLMPWCLERDIQVMAWGPLAGGPQSQYGPEFGAIYKSPVLEKLAKKHNINIGKLILSWVVLIPHSASLPCIEDNMRLLKLSQEDIDAINGIHKDMTQKRLIDGATFVWFDDAIPGKGRTIMGWTVQEIGWEDEKGNWLV